jgi:hypothetical protein
MLYIRSSGCWRLGIPNIITLGDGNLFWKIGNNITTFKNPKRRDTKSKSHAIL